MNTPNALTVARLSEITGIGLEKLLTVIKNAGLQGKTATSELSQEEKNTILTSLRSTRTAQSSNEKKTSSAGTLRLKKTPQTQIDSPSVAPSNKRNI